MPAKCRHPDGSLHDLYVFDNPAIGGAHAFCWGCKRLCPEITHAQAVSGDDTEFEAPPPPVIYDRAAEPGESGPQPCPKSRKAMNRSVFKKCYPGRSSDTISAIVRNYPGDKVTVNVPPCIYGTPMEALLVARLLGDKWEFNLLSEIDARWSAPLPKAKLCKMERQLGRRSEPVRKCWICEAPTHSKCNRCLEVYYCSEKCQKQHWEIHRAECKDPPPVITQHVSIAVPEYQCFFQYQEAVYAAADSSTRVGIMVMSRANFDDAYGYRNHVRTIVNLAVFGKPLILPTNTWFGS